MFILLYPCFFSLHMLSYPVENLILVFWLARFANQLLEQSCVYSSAASTLAVQGPGSRRFQARCSDTRAGSRRDGGAASVPVTVGSGGPSPRNPRLLAQPTSPRQRRRRLLGIRSRLRRRRRVRARAA
jgi:hypothetical protein